MRLGSCGIHITNNSFRKGVTEFGFDVETFVNEISFYFKMSAARRQDYKLMEMFTEIEAKYDLKHTIVRWLILKNPILRILEQWGNLDEYFLKYLPKQDNFISKISHHNATKE